jgi:hypothetical protein
LKQRMDAVFVHDVRQIRLEHEAVEQSRCNNLASYVEGPVAVISNGSMN